MAATSRDQESLVKYDTPILVSISHGKKTGSLPNLKTPPNQQRTEDYLNSILPPIEFTEKGKLWVRYVSPTPATTVDVTLLKNQLDKRLK